MVIIDVNQVMISSMMVTLGPHAAAEIDEDMFRHFVLNTLRALRVKFKDYGEMVIASDGRNCWRRDVFKYYKHKRKADRKASDIDWPAIFGVINKITAEIKEYFPYPVLNLDRAEADDIIATLVSLNGTGLAYPDKTTQIVIVSGDKDFIQLHRYANVIQWDNTKKKFLKPPKGDANMFLKEQILRGDKDDGIPNFLSDDDTFANESKRQKNIMAEKINKWMKQEVHEICADKTLLRNYKRNEMLIDLSHIPAEIKEAIKIEYDAQQGKGREKLFNYFIQFKLKNLQSAMGEF